MNKLLVVLAGLGLILSVQPVFAEDAPAVPVMEEAAPSADAMGNMMDDKMGEMVNSHADSKICPITGEAIAEGDQPTEVEYNGKKVKLCCSHCAEAFKKDPEAVMKKIEELEAAAAAAGKGEAATEAAPEAPAGQ